MTTDLFNDYESDIICVQDLVLHWNGALITHIAEGDDNQVTFWSGSPEDKFSHQLVIPENDCKEYLEDIESLM